MTTENENLHHTSKDNLTDDNETTTPDESMQVFSSVRFFVDDETLKAELNTDSLAEPLNPVVILELLKTSGFGGHQLDDEILAQLVEYSTTNKQCELSITSHTNAKYTINIDEQQLTATITVEPPQGGEDLDYDSILQELIDQSILLDFIDQSKLKRCLIDMDSTPTMIAKGLAPQRGTDTSFEILFNTNTQHDLNVSSKDNVNFYESHSYITVLKDQAVMKRIPATLGINGKTIFGEEISAMDGEIIEFQLNESVYIDGKNENLLLAAKKGHPIAINNGVQVDDTLHIENADLKSGNIHFDGSVHISGEVKPNVVIEATGDIHVGGMIENAKLLSGNNVSIAGGAIGVESHNKDSSMIEGIIEAQGSIHVKFCNNIKVEAKNDILIDDYSLHCELKANKSIQLGTNNGKGILIGGNARSGWGFTSNMIGSEAYVHTIIDIASIQDIKSAIKKRLGIIARTKSEYELLFKILNKIKNQGSPSTVGKVVLEKAIKIHLELLELKKTIEKEQRCLTKLRKEHEQRLESCLICRKSLYSNVEITVNDIQESINRTHKGCKVSCKELKLNIEPL